MRTQTVLRQLKFQQHSQTVKGKFKMAKFHGNIGYAMADVEASPGVWEPEKIVREAYGDVLRNSRRLQASDTVVDNVIVSNEISIVADPFAQENFHSIVYVEFMGAKWKVTNIEVRYPRLVLTLGGVYNG